MTFVAFMYYEFMCVHACMRVRGQGHRCCSECGVRHFSEVGSLLPPCKSYAMSLHSLGPRTLTGASRERRHDRHAQTEQARMVWAALSDGEATAPWTLCVCSLHGGRVMPTDEPGGKSLIQPAKETGLVDHGRRSLCREAVGRLGIAAGKATVDIFHTRTREGFASPGNQAEALGLWPGSALISQLYSLRVSSAPHSPGDRTWALRLGSEHLACWSIPLAPCHFFVFKQIVKLSLISQSCSHSGLL